MKKYSNHVKKNPLKSTKSFKIPFKVAWEYAKSYAPKKNKIDKNTYHSPTHWGFREETDSYGNPITENYVSEEEAQRQLNILTKRNKKTTNINSHLSLRRLNKSRVHGNIEYNKEVFEEKSKTPSHVTVKAKQKAEHIGGSINFPVGPAKLALFGTTTKVKGKSSESVAPYGVYNKTWKSIENNLGSSLGVQINENNRVGIQVNKKFFQNQKGSANQIRLNWDVMNLGGGNLHVNLTGSDPISGPKTKAMTLNYKVRF
jgi:hypothetical protein